MTRLYTRTGDAGTTGLIGGERRSKADLRIHAIGEVDELNAWFGQLRALVVQEPRVSRDELEPMLLEIQAELFELGAQLASPGGTARLCGHQIARIEQWIDRLDDALPPLRNFILPGGSPAAAQAHLARSVCRRAERTLIALREQEPSSQDDMSHQYLNRLSDWLFVLARTLGHAAGAETPWLPRS